MARKISAAEEAEQIAGPRTFGARAIALKCGWSVRKVYDDMDSGKLKCTRTGGRRVSTQDQIDAYRGLVASASSVTALSSRRDSTAPSPRRAAAK